MIASWSFCSASDAARNELSATSVAKIEVRKIDINITIEENAECSMERVGRATEKVKRRG